MLRLAFLLVAALPLAAPSPGARFLAMAAYDDAHHRVLLYGGAAAGDTILGDLWALEGRTWTRLSDAGPARIKAAFAYDAGRDRAVLFGGSRGDAQYDETWEWDGRRWAQIRIPGPSARNHPMAAYDPIAKVTLLFGGAADGLLSDTWAYDGRSWTLKDTKGPTKCLPHGMFFDQRRGRVVMITLTQEATRSANAMWEWTGTAWRPVPPTGPSTSQASIQALAPFGQAGMVLFDGDDARESRGRTWTFAGGEWTSAWLPGPTPRIGHAMVYDKAGRRTVLIGGSNRRAFFDDAWAWDGSAWQVIQP